MALWIAIGVAFGAMFGVTVFDNVGIGIAFGIPIGLASGVADRHRAPDKRNAKTANPLSVYLGNYLIYSFMAGAEACNCLVPTHRSKCCASFC